MRDCESRVRTPVLYTTSMRRCPICNRLDESSSFHDPARPRGHPVGSVWAVGLDVRDPHAVPQPAPSPFVPEAVTCSSPLIVSAVGLPQYAFGLRSILHPSTVVLVHAHAVGCVHVTRLRYTVSYAATARRDMAPSHRVPRPQTRGRAKVNHAHL